MGRSVGGRGERLRSVVCFVCPEAHAHAGWPFFFGGALHHHHHIVGGWARPHTPIGTERGCRPVRRCGMPRACGDQRRTCAHSPQSRSPRRDCRDNASVLISVPWRAPPPSVHPKHTHTQLHTPKSQKPKPLKPGATLEPPYEANTCISLPRSCGNLLGKESGKEEQDFTHKNSQRHRQPPHFPKVHSRSEPRPLPDTKGGRALL